MGSICSINRCPSTWPAYETGKHLKPEFGGETLWHVEYGTFDDYPEGPSPLEMFMRESVYKDLIAGKYSVSPDSDRLHRLILIDATGHPLKPLGSAVY